MRPAVRFILLVLIFFPVFLQGGEGNVTIIVTGNTSPDSTYADYPAKVHDLIASIHDENPDAVVHTGNVLRGGFSWTGITRQDIRRQGEKWKRTVSRVGAPLYHVPGEFDHFDGSLDPFRELSGRDLNYSVTLGKMLLVFMNTTSFLPTGAEWLSAELKLYPGHETVILFSHRPLPGTPLGKPGNPGFMAVIRANRVKAVISGEGATLARVDLDGVAYINAACGGLTESEKFYRYHNYYKIVTTGSSVTVTGHFVKGFR